MRPLSVQGAMVVDWARRDEPGVGIVPPRSTWRGGYGFARVHVVSWDGGSETCAADIDGVSVDGDTVRFPTRPRTVREARAEGEAWLLDGAPTRPHPQWPHLREPVQ